MTSLGPSGGLCGWMAANISVNREDMPDGCSLWLSTIRDGYPYLSVFGAQLQAHRLVAILWFGVDAVAGKDVHHLCGVKHCVRAEHLVPVTAEEHQRIHMGTLTPPVVARGTRDLVPAEVLEAVGAAGVKLLKKLGFTQEAA